MIGTHPKRVAISLLLVIALLVSIFPAIPALAAEGEVVDYTDAPQELTVPAMAYDESKIVLMWEKPDDYYESTSKIVDYEVFCDDVSLGLASENFKETYVYLNAYVEKFYATQSAEHYKITALSFAATGLEADTEYTFQVRAVYADGNYSAFSDELAWSTAPQPEIIDASDFGATYRTAKTGNLIIKGANNDAALIKEIEDNTAAIQAAIDATPYGGKVVLKGSGDNASPYYYTSGSLFLHSDMTIEIEKGAVLLGSPVLDHYPRSLLVYPYSEDIRTYGLLNAVTWDYLTLKNIRIVGEGIVDGNGWKDSSASNPWQNKVALDPDPGYPDPTGNGWRLPFYFAGSNTSVSANGIAAADAFDKSQADAIPNGSAAKSYSTRPNMTIVRGVDGIYYEGLTFKNCAHHGIVNYQSENVVANGTINMTFNDNNGDGIEFGDCLGILVMNNFWDTGDDTINFAAGQGATTRNLTDRVAAGEGRVFNNYIRNGHGGLLALGSHTGGWLGDMIAEDNLYCPAESASVGMLRMKSGSSTGGGVRNITLRDNAAHYSVSGGNIIVTDTSYNDGNASTAYSPESEYPVTYENINVRNLTVTGATTSYLVNVAKPGAGTISKAMVVRDFTVEDVNMISMGNNGGRISINGVSGFTFRNIKNQRTTSGNFTITDSKNIIVENCTGIADRYPDNLEWAPTDSIATGINGNIVDVLWPALDKATSYVVQVDMLDGYGYQKAATVTTASATLTLKPNTEYKVAVYAESANARTIEKLEAGITTGAGSVSSTVTLPGTKTLTPNGSAGSSWHTYRWTAATTTDPLGIQYYKVEAKDEDGDVKEFKAYFDHAGRTGYSLWGLNDGKDYTVTVTAVNWQGVESEAYTTASFTTMPATLMEIPEWDSASELKIVSGGQNLGEDIVLSWDASDVTDYANGDTAKFAGYRILVNGVALQPEGGGLDQANAKPTVAPGTTTYTLSTAKFKPDTEYVISVEAGDDILKISSGAGLGLAGSTGFTGTKNTELARNQVTFGKWTNHGPSIKVMFAANEIALDYNGGEGDAESVFLAPGRPYGELPVPTLAGFHFMGWSIDGTAAGIVNAEMIVSPDVTSLKAMWVVDNNMYVSVKAKNAVITPEEDAEYVISVENAKKLATATIWFEVDADFVAGKDVNALSGFETIGGLVWTQKGDTSIWEGRVTIGLMGGDSLTGIPEAELLSVKLDVLADVTGLTSFKLTRIDLSGYDEDGKAVFFDKELVVIKNGTVETEIVEYFSPYDVNHDKAVDQLDLTTAQKYYQAKSTDNDWDEAKIADVNDDGVVDIADMILILNNITW